MPTPYEQQEYVLLQKHTGIVYSGATHLYIAPSTPHGPPDTSAATISGGTANIKVKKSAVKATITIARLESDFPTTGYIMNSLTNILIGVGTICDADCKVVFMKKYVTALSPKGKAVLTGWREKKIPRLWRLSLKPTEQLIKDYTTTSQTTPVAHSDYDLPIVEALVRYMHEASGLPVKSTWIKATKKRKLCDIARIDILQCIKILSTCIGDYQREYGSILARSAIH